MELAGSKTEKNLMTALLGESLARNRYSYFAAKARAEGFSSVADNFDKTAEQEKTHARMFFEQLGGNTVEVNAGYSTGLLRETRDNLETAATGENHEWSKLYPDFADVADAEGFSQVAELFRKISVAEQLHERKFNEHRKNIDAKAVEQSGVPFVWSCNICGFTSDGPEAPDACPLCKADKSAFEMFVSVQV